MKNFLKHPPLGWNSWDCFGAAVTEQQIKENAQYMAEKLKQYGWEYIVCDIQWYEPKAKGNDYNSFTELYMDEYGRLIPAPNRFESAGLPGSYYLGTQKFNDGSDFKGFSDLAEYVHSLGLKFGIHIMRGIPRQAVTLNLPIKNSSYTAREIAHPFSVCSWNTDMYGLKNCPGSQDYYDSIISMYADWGIDFIKCDDIAVTEFSKESNPYSADYEIEMIRSAIDKTGKNIVLSLSPGPARLCDSEHLKANANMWRMTGDFWDDWSKLLNMFDRCKAWQGIGGEGSYPDCDMLPLGRLCKNASYCGEQNRYSKFTKDEQYTLMSLWGIFGSPLFFGGNMPENDEFTLSLLTNSEYIKMQQNCKNSREISRTEECVIWSADGEDCSYLAVFNISDEEITTDISVYTGESSKYDIWLNKTTEETKFTIPPHGVKLFRY